MRWRAISAARRSLSPFLTGAFWLSITRCAHPLSQAELLAIADELEHLACDSECRPFVREVGGSVSAAA